MSSSSLPSTSPSFLFTQAGLPSRSADTELIPSATHHDISSNEPPIRSRSPSPLPSGMNHHYRQSPSPGLLDAQYAVSTSETHASSPADSLRSGAYQGEAAEQARIVKGRNLRVNTLHQRVYHTDELSPLPYPESSFVGQEKPATSVSDLPDSTSNSKFRDSRPTPYFIRRLWPTPLFRRIRNLPDSPGMWLALYFCVNLSLTLYNKSVLIHFPFPYTLTALHALCGTIGTFILLRTGQGGAESSNRPAAAAARALTSVSPIHQGGVPVLSGRELVVLFLFSILYTLNIVVSNASLRLVTVPFHQVVRASTPFFTIMFSAAVLGKKCSRRKLLSLIPVVAGVGFATYGDYYFTALGLTLTLLGTLLASMKTIITNLILVKGPAPSNSSLPTSHDSHPNLPSLISPSASAEWKTNPDPHFRHTSPIQVRSSQPLIPPNFFSSLFNLTVNQLFPPSPSSSPTYPIKSLAGSVPTSLSAGTGSLGLFTFPKLSLSPLHLLYLLSPLAFIETTLMAHFTGELDRVRWFLFEGAVGENKAAAAFGGHQRTWLLLNGVLAFFLNVVSFNANRKVGPLGMSVAANVKQVLTVLCAVVIFDLTITPANGIGIVLTLLGGAMYAMVELKEKREVKSRIG